MPVDRGDSDSCLFWERCCWPDCRQTIRSPLSQLLQYGSGTTISRCFCLNAGHRETPCRLPHLRDPNFAEAIILLLEYSQDGAMGVLINRPTTVPLASVLSKVKALKKRKELVYIGGPVGRNQMLLLARAAKEPKDSKRVLSNVYLVASQTSLQQLVGQSDSSLKLRAYAGYAGWASGQLDAEVSRGDWHIQSTDAAAVFDAPSDQLWPELIRQSELEWTRNDQSHERTARSLY